MMKRDVPPKPRAKAKSPEEARRSASDRLGTLLKGDDLKKGGSQDMGKECHYRASKEGVWAGGLYRICEDEDRGQI